MDDYSYRPRRGFDIRVSKTRGKKNAQAAQKNDERRCAFPGCDQPACVHVRKSPQKLDDMVWLCQQHAREHHRKWDFFASMSEEAARSYARSAAYGHRPTWKLATDARNARLGLGTTRDPLALFGYHNRRSDAKHATEGRKLTRLQAQAFETLHLSENVSPASVRKRYSELIKRYHPDSNKGDRSYEDRLQAVMRAFRILKNGGMG